MKFLIREAIALIAAAVIGLCAVVGCLAYKCDSYKEHEPDNASFTGVMGKTSAELENYAHFSLVDTNYEPAVFSKIIRPILLPFCRAENTTAFQNTTRFSSRFFFSTV